MVGFLTLATFPLLFLIRRIFATNIPVTAICLQHVQKILIVQILAKHVYKLYPRHIRQYQIDIPTRRIRLLQQLVPDPPTGNPYGGAGTVPISCRHQQVKNFFLTCGQ